MKTAIHRFSNVIKDGIGPILKDNGFKRQRQNFFRQIGEIGHAVNIQKDKRNTKDEIKFTINVGIFYSKYWLAELDFTNSKNLPVFPKESESIIRERIGELKFGEDYWYSIESQRIERKLIKDVEQDIKEYILPFFNGIDTTEKLIKYLESNPAIFSNDYKLLIVLAEEGLFKEAQIMFNKIMQKCPKRYIENMEEKRMKYHLKNEDITKK